MNWDTELEKVAAKTKYPIGDGDHGAIKPACYQDHGVPYIRVADITWESQIVRSKMVYIPQEVNEANPKSFLYPGDIVISKTGATIGKVAIIPDDIKIANTTASIGKVTLDTDLAIPKYVLWCMKSHQFQTQMWRVSHKSAQPGFNVKDLKKFKIPLPPLDQQKKIAAILDAADAYRQKTKALIEKYDALTQSLFLDMFGDPVSNPKGWEVSFLKQITTKIGSGATPRGGKQAYKKEGVSLIRSMNVYDNRFKYKNLAFIDEEQAAKLKNVIVEKGDVLFNITGASICRSSVVPNDVLPARVNQHVSILRPIKSIITSKFLSRFLISKNVKTKLLGVGSGGGAVMEAITKEQLQNIEVIVPPLDLQNQFADSVQAIEAQKAQAQASLVQAEDLFNSLLQRAFKGELV